jgi:hypothetical protein
MTVIIETPPSTGAHGLPVRGRARWAAAALLTVGGALQVLEFALEPVTNGTSAERVAWWADHSAQISVSQAAGILAIPFLIGGFLTMAKLTRQHTRRLTAVAVTLLTGGMVGLAVVHGVEMTANWLVQAGDTRSALKVLEMSEPGAAGIATFVLFVVGAMLGSLALLVALFRSPYVPRAACVLMLAFMVLDFVVGQGVAGHVAALASGTVLAWAVVTGYARAPRPSRTERAH